MDGTQGLQFQGELANACLWRIAQQARAVGSERRGEMGCESREFLSGIEPEEHPPLHPVGPLRQPRQQVAGVERDEAHRQAPVDHVDHSAGKSYSRV